ncbi:hypothetical protein ACQPZP_20610 [Spirillospora sp. CA-142024]|uniref:hypothetical protein n=1 Tax=Spirillospora sp. CA-142024 TaxID=3240036 RepID=UPI003D8C9A24
MTRRLRLRLGPATLTASALLGVLVHAAGATIGEKDASSDRSVDDAPHDDKVIASTATALAKALGRL